MPTQTTFGTVDDKSALPVPDVVCAHQTSMGRPCHSSLYGLWHGVVNQSRRPFHRVVSRLGLKMQTETVSFDLSPALCYAQRPLCAAGLPESGVEDTECSSPMGQNLVIAVCPYGGCNRCGVCML